MGQVLMTTMDNMTTTSETLTVRFGMAFTSSFHFDVKSKCELTNQAPMRPRFCGVG